MALISFQMSLKNAASINKNHIKVLKVNNIILDINKDNAYLEILKDKLKYSDYRYTENALIQITVSGHRNPSTDFTTE